MRKFAICFLFSFILLSTLVLADGGIVVPPNYDKDVYLPEQKAAIFWDGTEQKMILSTNALLSPLCRSQRAPLPAGWEGEDD